MAIDFSDLPGEPWAAVGYVVRLRRNRLGLDQGELKRLGGPGPSTVGKIERGDQGSFPLRTQHALENSLGWNRGAVERLLEAVSMGEDSWWSNPEIRDDYLEDLVIENVPDLAMGHGLPEPAVAWPVERASDLTDDELLAELTYRVKKYTEEIERFRDVAPAAQKNVSPLRPGGAGAAGHAPPPEGELADEAARPDTDGTDDGDEPRNQSVKP